MSNYSFATMPSVSISRSRFRRTSQHKTSFNLGQLIPVYVDEVLPGDTRSFDLAALVRMSTPIAPIMDNIVLDFYAFFVPHRLVWDHWKEFLGENSSGAGIPTVNYNIPQLGDTLGAWPAVSGLLDYMGVSLNGKALQTVLSNTKISALPVRAYYKIFDHWFRNENVIAPSPINTGDTAGALLDYTDSNYVMLTGSTGDVYDFALIPLKAAKLADYFTKSLPYAQKGAAVKVPLGSSAPVGFIPSSSVSPGTATFSQLGATAGNFDAVHYISGGTTYPLVADLSTATAATINELRYAFQLQKLLEKDALYGTKYWSILAAHFGVQAPDASIQVPEFLGGKRMHINIDQVLQTTGFNSTPSSNSLGTPGANSVSGFKGSLFTKSFVEHGTLMVIAVARQENHTYGQGLNRMWNRFGRYDYYWPVFANLGAQDVKRSEIFVQGSSADAGVFGYQEAWAEYRYKPSIVSGLMNPFQANSLDYWTLAEKWTNAPTLGRAFIEEDRSNLIRALVTGSNGPDFIGDFYFEDVAVRPMPTYSVPGLIDHH